MLTIQLSIFWVFLKLIITYDCDDKQPEGEARIKDNAYAMLKVLKLISLSFHYASL